MSWRRLAHYGGAVLAAGVAIAAREFLIPELGLELPYITLFPAVAFSGWLGGFGPGAMCTALDALAVAYLWVPSTRDFARVPTLGDGVGLALFCGAGLFVSALAEARVQALARTKRQVEEVRQAQELERQARSEAEHANRAHGGTIEAASDGPGRGSEFRIKSARRELAVPGVSGTG